MNIPHVESPFFAEHFPKDTTDPEVLRIAESLREDGFATFQFPDDQLSKRIVRIQKELTDRYEWDKWRSGELPGLRVPDAWTVSDDVKQIATNQTVMDLLSKLYGKEAFPAFSLNFPVGTQQHVHSDMVHFSSIPERYMCGVWVAFEDVHPDAGPLSYYPGSHKLPFYGNEQLGTVIEADDHIYANYHEYEKFWERLIKAEKLERVEYLPKKGEALIWSSNLLHGGAAQNDMNRTRWSQVTHYLFKGCTFLTPLGSLPYLGSIEYRRPINVATGEAVPNELNGVPITDEMIDQLSRKTFDRKSRRAA